MFHIIFYICLYSREIIDLFTDSTKAVTLDICGTLFMGELSNFALLQSDLLGLPVYTRFDDLDLI